MNGPLAEPRAALQRTLRSKLLRWLLAPLATLGVVNAVHTHVAVRRAMNAAYDRSLYASALAISEHVTLGGNGPFVDLPPVALEMLDTGDQERIFYRVAYDTAERPGVFVTGYSDLPAPPPDAFGEQRETGRHGRTVFYEEEYHGDPVRIVALQTTLRAEQPLLVKVQVAETLLGRKSRVRAIVARALGSQVILILLAGFLVWLGISRGLAPLSDLSREVARRSAADLAPLQLRDVPREVSPLIGAVNQLMTRVREAIAAHRRFIADASHQLRTPLTVLRTQAEYALRQDQVEPMRAAVAQLRDHSQATSHLANQLLSLARAEPTTGDAASEELFDLIALAREACSSLVPEALARGVDLGFEVPEGFGQANVRGRSYLVRELIANLVDNALRYGAPAGTITVGVSPAGTHAFRLTVEDDGPGIPQRERGRVFERFYRLPGSAGSGAGLGLSIVGEIARGHQAAVRLFDGASGRGLLVEVVFHSARPDA
jgi:two-component system sensor histidine kinase TctE